MDEGIRLKNIYIGKADGLQEAEEDKFEELFYKGNRKYDTLCEDTSKFIISGRKGTGKTILAKYFEKEQSKNKVPTRTITDRDIILRQFMENGSIELKNKEVELFIEYTILVELSKLILDNISLLKSPRLLLNFFGIRKKVRYLRSVVKERNNSGNFQKTYYDSRNSIESSNKISSNNKKIGLGVENTSNIANEVSYRYEKNPYYKQISALKENVYYLLEFLPANIIFDDLDEYDEIIIGNAAFIKFFNALINVAYKVNVEIKNRGIRNSRVIIIMRSDILSILNSSSKNLNKIVADSEIRLNWMKKRVDQDEKETFHPLMDLVLAKIQKSNKALENTTKKEIFDMFFPVTVNGIPVIDYMLNNSFGRPRDIINMLNTIRDEYGDEFKFTAEHFKNTQLEYSNKFADELRNEMSSYCVAAKIEEFFMIIKLINQRVFWLSNVNKVFQNHRDKIKYFSNGKEFVEFAYKFGVLGNQWNNSKLDSNRKKNFSWKYREDGSDYVDFDKKLCLHFALRKSLLQ